MKAEVFDQKNKKVEEINLPDRIFEIEWSADLVQQVLLAQLANKRMPWAHVKDRSEVRGGGKKPWKQKGTGRARHGSTRSPLWAGGGVTFGPRNDRDYSQKVNKQMKRKAIFSILAKKLQDGEVKIIDSFKIEPPKAKIAAGILKNIVKSPVNALLIAGSSKSKIKQIVKNIKNINAISPLSLNAYDLLKYRDIILEKSAIEIIGKHYAK